MQIIRLNGITHLECRIMLNVLALTVEEEVRALSHNGKTDVPIQVTVS